MFMSWLSGSVGLSETGLALTGSWLSLRSLCLWSLTLRVTPPCLWSACANCHPPGMSEALSSCHSRSLCLQWTAHPSVAMVLQSSAPCCSCQAVFAVSLLQLGILSGSRTAVLQLPLSCIHQHFCRELRVFKIYLLILNFRHPHFCRDLRVCTIPLWVCVDSPPLWASTFL